MSDRNTRDTDKTGMTGWSGTKAQPTTVAQLLGLDRIMEEAKAVVKQTFDILTDMPSEVANIITGIINDVEDGREGFTTGRFIEKAQEAMRQNGYENEANLLSETLANNPEIAEQELTAADMRELGIDMSDGRTELVGEPQREDGEPRFVLGQNRTPAFEYDTIGADGEMTTTEQVTRDMYGLEPLEQEATQGARWSVENADLSQGAAPDPAVEKIQGTLDVLGFDLGPDGADGYFGPQTDAAVRSFQEQYNAQTGQSIAVDGIVGPETIGAMRRAIEAGLRF